MPRYPMLSGNRRRKGQQEVRCSFLDQICDFSLVFRCKGQLPFWRKIQPADRLEPQNLRRLVLLCFALLLKFLERSDWNIRLFFGQNR